MDRSRALVASVDGGRAQTLFAEVNVRDDRIVETKLASPEYLPLIASATVRAQVGVAPPDGLPGAIGKVPDVLAWYAETSDPTDIARSERLAARFESALH